ncbi:MAG: outer spore coat protein CotE [Bacillales bacterium]|nr:outer spore coat protein CotE [Bacillales bacterium]
MYRDIIAKTLVGKGKLNQLIEKKIKLEEFVSKLLGCWVINLSYETKKEKDDVIIEGSFDIQLWYAFENDRKSQVYVEKVDFKETIKMFYRDYRIYDEESFIKVYVNTYPKCSKMEIVDGEVNLVIEGVYYIDCFQDALLQVNCLDEYVEDVSLDEEIVMNVNPNYIETNKQKE